MPNDAKLGLVVVTKIQLTRLFTGRDLKIPRYKMPTHAVFVIFLSPVICPFVTYHLFIA